MAPHPHIKCLVLRVREGLHAQHVHVVLVADERALLNVHIGVGHEVPHLLVFVVTQRFNAKPRDTAAILQAVDKLARENPANCRHIKLLILAGRDGFLQPVVITSRTVENGVLQR